jgi:hypothetical protein
LINSGVFNPVRPVGELKLHFFLLNFIQDKMLQSTKQEKRKKSGWGPDEKKTKVCSVLVE